MADIKEIRKKLNVLNDYLFQKVFGEKGDEVQLISFLNATLKRTGIPKIKVIKIIESKTFRPDIIGMKGSILDLMAVMENGTRINIEVQLRTLKSMPKRSMFYWSKMFAEELEAGEEYEKLAPGITINIVDFEIINLPEFHTSYHMREDNHQDYILTDSIETHFIEMPKFRRLPDKDIQNNDMHRWLTFFDKETPPEVIQEIIDMDNAVRQAYDKVEEVSRDKEAMHLYEVREKAIRDYNSGIAEAKKEARLEEKIELAKNALAKDLSVDMIAELTGLDKATIEGLRPQVH